jgi:integrase
MATSNIAKRPDGKYRARYRDPAGREHAKHFRTKKDAQRWLDEVTASIVTGQYVSPSAGKMTFKEYAEEWRASQVHRPSTQARVEIMLRVHAYPVFGDRPLNSILPTHIQTWVKKMSLTHAASSVVGAHGVISGIFLSAVRDRRIQHNPCQHSKLPKVDPKRVTPLLTEQVRALEDAAPARWQAAITLAAATGMRQGEVFGLTVDRIDFFRKTVRVDQQMTEVAGLEPVLGPPKTRASVRVIPLPDVAVRALAAHLKAYPAGPSGLVFTREDGTPMRRTKWNRIWAPLRKRAGLPAGVTFHDLRHYYASLLIRFGESVKTVQARLGHASAAETLDTYSHLWPDSEDQTRTAVDSVFGATEAPAQVADFLRTEHPPEVLRRRSDAV